MVWEQQRARGGGMGGALLIVSATDRPSHHFIPCSLCTPCWVAMRRLSRLFKSAARLPALPRLARRQCPLPPTTTRVRSEVRTRAAPSAESAPHPHLPPPPHFRSSRTRLLLPSSAIVVSSDIPSFGTPEWEAFVEKDPNNFQVWLESGFKTA